MPPGPLAKRGLRPRLIASRSHHLSCSHLSLVTAPGPHSNPGSATGNVRPKTNLLTSVSAFARSDVVSQRDAFPSNWYCLLKLQSGENERKNEAEYGGRCGFWAAESVGKLIHTPWVRSESTSGPTYFSSFDSHRHSRCVNVILSLCKAV